MNKGEGRSVFASKPLKKGELIVVERAIAEASGDDQLGRSEQLVKKCTALAGLNGVEALRMSYLDDGRENTSLELPPIKVFVENYYKEYQIPTLTDERLKKVIHHNSFHVLANLEDIGGSQNWDISNPDK